MSARQLPLGIDRVTQVRLTLMVLMVTLMVMVLMVAMAVVMVMVWGLGGQLPVRIDQVTQVRLLLMETVRGCPDRHGYGDADSGGGRRKFDGLGDNPGSHGDGDGDGDGGYI